MKRIGRCMGYLQVAAEIEALASGADKDAVVRQALRDFDNPPFKKVPAYWFHPGLTILKDVYKLARYLLPDNRRKMRSFCDLA